MNIKTELANWMQEHLDDTLELLKGLIRVNTVNPPGNEQRAADVLTSFYDKHKVAWENLPSPAGRPNIIASLGQGETKLLAAAHLDTVPIGDGWTKDPFGAVIEGNKMYGRGTADNKGQLAGIAALMPFFKSIETKLSGKITIIAPSDEEAGSIHGFEFLAKQGQLKADFAIIPDIGEHMEVISVAEKGGYFFKVISKGKQAHGSTPEKGKNAITYLMRFLEKFENYQPSVSTHPLLGKPTHNVGMIKGGAAPNIVAGQAEAYIDLRYLPGNTGADIRKDLEAIAKSIEGADLEIRPDTALEPIELDSDLPGVKILADTAEQVLGKRPKLIGLGGTTVCKQLFNIGTPAVGFSFGNSDTFHMADEYIEIDEIVPFQKIIGLTALELASNE